jgi:hypothetical protein
MQAAEPEQLFDAMAKIRGRPREDHSVAEVRDPEVASEGGSGGSIGSCEGGAGGSLTGAGLGSAGFGWG